VVPGLIQILAVVTLAAVVRVVLRRLGVELDFPRTTAIAVLLLLVQPTVVNMRSAWLRLDQQREAGASLRGKPDVATAACLEKAAIDVEFLGFVGSRIPPRERFHLISESLVSRGELCIRFLLLPRVEVERPEQARYIVFWDPPLPRRTLAAARRKGLDVEVFSDTKAIAVRP
jgi:hypothetical protein